MRRSSDMWHVGYFLSCHGERGVRRAPSPPAPLQAGEWNRAYAMFYRELGEGRSLSAFANSLKNARDTFDAHLGSGRVGWRTGDAARAPAELPKAARAVLQRWSGRPVSDVWTYVREFADLAVRDVSDGILTDLFAESEVDGPPLQVRTEGGRRAIVVNRVERDPSLRSAALRVHGCRCQVCGFSFEEFYGSWGRGFAVVHHLRMLSDSSGAERLTDPAADLAVLCANCHCMVHRRRRVVLTLAELSAKLVG